MVTVPVATLTSNGRTIPLVGFGTAEFPFNSTESTEQSLGEAIAEALHLGLITSRDELFITSKLWSGDAHLELVVPAIKNSLENLGLEYLDLYLIHFPGSVKPGTGFPFKTEDIVEMDIVCVGGHGGVEMNPVWQQKKLREFCEEKGIHITAYSPLGAKGVVWGTNRVMDSQVLKEIAIAKGKTVAQLIRFLSQFIPIFFKLSELILVIFSSERTRFNA
ncbi:hypothetical protein Pint_22041 [Pistacia integerrima]|uniref:Uncharacterized protein n=1 Tax=Pistacia integerrima TaxID=434235 RepID=A0ACC0YHY2_9ROSI|nr:hypothetical protein Pint_22041 [Pistacia integerrima]